MKRLFHHIRCCFVAFHEEFGEEAMIDEIRLLTVVMPMLAFLLIGVAVMFDGTGG